MSTDSELMDAFISHEDASAFNEIVRRYQKLVWNVAFRFTADIENSKDIVQDTFVRLVEASSRYTASASLSTFIYRIVTNLCLDYKKKKRLVNIENVDSVTDVAYEEDFGDTFEKSNKISQLTSAVSALPTRQKLAIIYKYDHELSIREIASLMKTTEKSVERLLYHGRAGLKIKLKQFE